MQVVCNHTGHEAHVSVLIAKDKREATIEVKCSQCGVPMCFDKSSVKLNVDRTQATIEISPKISHDPDPLFPPEDYEKV